jgi:hypothetical protein
MSMLEENVKHLFESLNTEGKIDAFVDRFSTVLALQEANAKAEAELLVKLDKALDLLMK